MAEDDRTAAQRVTDVAVQGGGKVRAYSQLAVLGAGLIALLVKDDPTLGFVLIGASGLGLGLQGFGALRGGAK